MSNTRTVTRDGRTPDVPESVADLIGRIKPIERSLQVCINGALWASFDQAEYELAMHRRHHLKPAQDALEHLIVTRGAPALDEAEPVSGAMPAGDTDPVIAEARAALQSAKARELDLERTVQSIIEEAREHTITVRVRTFPGGRKAYTDLVHQHETGDVLYLRDEQGGIVHDDQGKPIPRVDNHGDPVREVDLTTFQPEVLARACLYPKFADADEARQFIDALDSPTTVDSICNAVARATEQGLSVPFSTLVSTTPPQGSEQN